MLSVPTLAILAFSLLAPAYAKTLSQKCSGWTPEDCMRVKGCMNCYDGFRVDCFPENSSQVYGSLWCGSRTDTNNTCAGREREKCGKTEGCVYCESAAVGNQCYTTEEAKKLPAAIFSCGLPGPVA